MNLEEECKLLDKDDLKYIELKSFSKTKNLSFDSIRIVHVMEKTVKYLFSFLKNEKVPSNIPKTQKKFSLDSCDNPVKRFLQAEDHIREIKAELKFLLSEMLSKDFNVFLVNTRNTSNIKVKSNINSKKNNINDNKLEEYSFANIDDIMSILRNQHPILLESSKETITNKENLAFKALEEFTSKIHRILLLTKQIMDFYYLAQFLFRDTSVSLLLNIINKDITSEKLNKANITLMDYEAVYSGLFASQIADCYEILCNQDLDLFIRNEYELLKNIDKEFFSCLRTKISHTCISLLQMHQSFLLHKTIFYIDSNEETCEMLKRLSTTKKVIIEILELINLRSKENTINNEKQMETIDMKASILLYNNTISLVRRYSSKEYYKILNTLQCLYSESNINPLYFLRFQFVCLKKQLEQCVRFGKIAVSAKKLSLEQIIKYCRNNLISNHNNTEGEVICGLLFVLLTLNIENSVKERALSLLKDELGYSSDKNNGQKDFLGSDIEILLLPNTLLKSQVDSITKSYEPLLKILLGFSGRIKLMIDQIILECLNKHDS